jgi:hypothetical protein
MRVPVPNPDGTAVIEVDDQTHACIVDGCGGAIVRHSLGGGQSVRRCTKCFRRYQVRSAPAISASERSRLRRVFDEWVNWRDD